MPLPPLVSPVPELSPAEAARTARHARLAGFGPVAQRRLAAAHVAIVGAGGLGSPTVLALAAAGVGRITILDDDTVEVSNLHRQVIHRLDDVGRLKVDSARRVAADLSPETVVDAVARRLDDSSADELLCGVDLVLDGTDTFDTREAVARSCERSGIPLVWGTVQGFDAQVTVFWSRPPAGVAPVVLADLYPPGSVGEIPTCEDVGVLGSLCMQVGALMASQAISLITGVGEPLLGRVLVIDGLRARQREVPLRPARATASPRVAVVGEHRPDPAYVTSRHLRAALASKTPPDVLDVRELDEYVTGAIPASRSIPLQQVLDDPASAASGPVVVVCQAGVRARRAADALLAHGIEASVLTGGMNAWESDDESARPREGAIG